MIDDRRFATFAVVRSKVKVYTLEKNKMALGRPVVIVEMEREKKPLTSSALVALPTSHRHSIDSVCALQCSAVHAVREKFV